MSLGHNSAEALGSRKKANGMSSTLVDDLLFESEGDTARC